MSDQKPNEILSSAAIFWHKSYLSRSIGTSLPVEVNALLSSKWTAEEGRNLDYGLPFVTDGVHDLQQAIEEFSPLWKLGECPLLEIDWDL